MFEAEYLVVASDGEPVSCTSLQEALMLAIAWCAVVIVRLWKDGYPVHQFDVMDYTPSGAVLQQSAVLHSI